MAFDLEPQASGLWLSHFAAWSCLMSLSKQYEPALLLHQKICRGLPRESYICLSFPKSRFVASLQFSAMKRGKSRLPLEPHLLQLLNISSFPLIDHRKH